MPPIKGNNRIHAFPTEALMIQTISRSRLTAKSIASLTGCSYPSVSYLLASMYRKGILERDPDNYSPLHYWLLEENYGMISGDEIPPARLDRGIITEEVKYLIKIRNSITRRLRKFGVD